MSRRQLIHGERGGPALLFLIMFMAMAIPIATGALHTSAQLAQNSRVYERSLNGDYDAGSGIEVAIHEALGDPTFDDGLVPSSPDKTIAADVNGQSTTVIATKVFPTVALTGQGMSVSKSVTPATAVPGVATSFTYTVTFTNEGTDAVKLLKILDFMPPHFSYAGNTGGVTTADPVVNSGGSPVSCGDTPYRLEWILGVPVSLEVEEKAVLTFMANATLDEGTYFNQVRATYEPWWDDTLEVEVSSPSTAAVAVGSGSPTCRYGDVLVTKSVSPVVAEPGVQTEFTYTVSIENTSGAGFPLYEVEDLLPPNFRYVASSTSGVIGLDPIQALDPDLARWRLTWGDLEAAPITTIASGATEVMVFRATGIVEAGINYLNEISASSVTTSVLYGVEAYADVVLAIDNSGSVDSSELQELKDASNAIVDAFSLSATEGRIRIGVFRFRGSSESVVDVTDVDIHPTNTPLHDGINGLVQGGPGLSSGSNIVVGLQGGAGQFATGLGDRPEIPNLMIFITDGDDTAGNSMADIAAASAASGAEVFAIGAGTAVATTTLDAIASEPDGDHVFSTADFSGLLDLVDAIVAAAFDASQLGIRVSGGAAASVSAGTIYDVESTSQEGSAVKSRVLITPDGAAEIVSWQKQ